MTWNPAEHSDQENLQWCWLRAIEWSHWPLFLSLPIAPPLLLILSPWAVLAVLLVLDIAWSAVRYRFISVRLASAAVLFALLRWVSSPVAAILLFTHGRWATALLALFWPFIVPVAGLVTHPPVGRLQVEFMRRLGYEPSDSNPLHEPP